MAKKKAKLKSIFKTKLTKTQIVFSLIFLVSIFSGLGLFLLSNDTILHYRMLLYSKELQAKNDYVTYLQNLTPTPTPIPSLAPGQNTTYTFHIQAGNGNDKTDAYGNPIIHATLTQGHVNTVILDSTMNGRTLELPVHTLIYLRFSGTTYYDIKITPNIGVVEMPGKYPPSVPVGYSGLLHVVGQGLATIQVEETASPQVIPTSTFEPITTTNCKSVEYTSSKAANFIAAYYSKAPNDRIDSLHLIVVCGTPSMGGYATQFTLTASEGIISSSQFSYADASPPGPTTKNTCSLSVTGSHSAVVTCGESSFTLAY